MDSKYGMLFIFLFLSFLFSVLWMFDYKIWSNTKQNVKSSNIVFVLDVSKSMLVQDYGEFSRLAVAKTFISNYVNTHPNNKYSLVIFSQDVTCVLPLTSDKKLLLTILSATDEKSLLHGGTNFSGALKESISRFIEINQGWWVILVSDFETNLLNKEKQDLLNELKIISKEFQKKSIEYIGVWIWLEKWWKIPESHDIMWNPIFKKDQYGNVVVSKFDGDFFTNMSQIFSGEWIKISTTFDLDRVYNFEIPGDLTEINITTHTLLWKYALMIAYVCFLLFIWFYYFFDKKWK